MGRSIHWIEDGDRLRPWAPAVLDKFHPAIPLPSGSRRNSRGVRPKSPETAVKEGDESAHQELVPKAEFHADGGAGQI
jgi:hypothetical protein